MGPGLVYIARMRATPPITDLTRTLNRRLMPLAAVIVLAGLVYYILGRGGLSLEALVRHEMGAVVEERLGLTVPLEVSVGVGRSWDDAAH